MSKQSYHHGDLPAALLKAAEQELKEHGMARFSLRSVAKRAGVSHGAPAHHFGGVQGLLTALAAKGYERLLACQSEEQRKCAADPRAKSVASGLGYIAFATQNPELFRLMFASELPDRDDPQFADTSLKTFDKLVLEIQDRTGKNPWQDAEAMQELMASWALVHGLAELIVSGRAERPLGLAGLSEADRRAVLMDIVERLVPDAPR